MVVAIVKVVVVMVMLGRRKTDEDVMKRGGRDKNGREIYGWKE